MRNDPQLNEAFMQGRNAAASVACPYLWSSAMFDAWHSGRYSARLGFAAPKMVNSGRGSRIRTDTHLFVVSYQKDGGVMVSIL